MTLTLSRLVLASEVKIRGRISQMDSCKETQKKETPPPSTPPRKGFNRKTLVGAGGLCLAVLITIGVLVGTFATQKTYNGSRDILRTLETAAGVRITLYTTGM